MNTYIVMTEEEIRNYKPTKRDIRLQKKADRLIKKRNYPFDPECPPQTKEQLSHYYHLYPDPNSKESVLERRLRQGKEEDGGEESVR